MKLLVIRHAKAEERSAALLFKKKDANRRLTEEGRKTMRRNAKGLRELAPDIDVLATSPLLRARETAEIVADVLGIKEIRELPLLAPDSDPGALIAWLKEQPESSTVAVVGHEPHLSTSAGLLLGGNTQSFLVLKKGACCLIEFEGTPAAGSGMLLWLLQPGQLKEIDA